MCLAVAENVVHLLLVCDETLDRELERGECTFLRSLHLGRLFYDLLDPLVHFTLFALKLLLVHCDCVLDEKRVSCRNCVSIVDHSQPQLHEKRYQWLIDSAKARKCSTNSSQDLCELGEATLNVSRLAVPVTNLLR